MNYRQKFFFMHFIFFFGICICGKNRGADLIIFSYDRPLQLYAFLESVEIYMTGVASKHVVYRTSSERYEKAYDVIQNNFDVTMYHQQTEKDFRSFVLKALSQGKTAYVLFAVDDMIVKDYVDIYECVEYLRLTRAYGFYLRLGTHLSFCYTMNKKQPVPPYKEIKKNVCSWIFDEGVYDWNYPHTVDMTIYEKKLVLADFLSLSFYNPNSLEQQWMNMYVRYKPACARGLFFAHSKVVNIPLNKVQEGWDNRFMEGYNPEDLLKLFEDGLKIDINPLYHVANNGAHIEYTPTYVSRVKIKKGE